MKIPCEGCLVFTMCKSKCSMVYDDRLYININRLSTICNIFKNWKPGDIIDKYFTTIEVFGCYGWWD